MKHSAKGQTPPCLTDWLGLTNENWVPSYGALAGAPRRGTHQALLDEQGYVCAYCGRGLKEDRSDSHIDHFWPQEHFNATSPPDRTLDYTNFFASCGPPRHPLGHPNREPSTCGDAKGSWFHATDHVIPSDLGCEARFRYEASGRIASAAIGDTAADNMIQQLNLEHEALIYERKQIIAGIETDIISGEITATTKGIEVQLWRARDATNRLKSFGHVAARYLENEPL